MHTFFARAPSRLLFRAVGLALVFSLAGCASMLFRDPIRINVVGIEPLQGQGLEVRFAVSLRVQNPNDAAIDYNGVALELELNGQPFATGVSNQEGAVPGFGESVLRVPVTVSAFSAMRQALQLADSAGRLNDLPYVLRGKLAGGAFGSMRFVDEGRLSLPGTTAR